MRTKLIKIVFAVLLISFWPIVAKSEIITIGIEATVNSVDDYYDLLEGNVNVGDTITGTYTYDTSTPDTNPLQVYGTYLHSGAPYGVVLTVGSLTFETDPLNVNFSVGIANDNQGNDSYSIGSYNNLALANGVIVDLLSWDLTDNLGTAISTTDLPITPPDLSKWPFNNLVIGGGRWNTTLL